jgi:hypothetical protein
MTALSVTEVTLRNEIGVFADTPFQKPKADGFTWDFGEFGSHALWSPSAVTLTRTLHAFFDKSLLKNDK